MAAGIHEVREYEKINGQKKLLKRTSVRRCPLFTYKTYKIRHQSTRRSRKERRKAMEQTRYLISDAAKKVEVESHVLRYWEDELEIPIKRNELGHRYYTQEDLERFREIKILKEQGLQLKAIRVILKNGRLEPWDGRMTGGTGAEEFAEGRNGEAGAKEERMEENMGAEAAVTNRAADGHIISEQERHMIEIIRKRDIAEVREESREEKNARLQLLLQHMIAEAVRENNRELCEDIKQCLLKEMDYQFRMQEERTQEREDERMRKEEEHYKALDELIRSYSSKKGKRAKEEKKKTVRFGLKKKPSII